MNIINYCSFLALQVRANLITYMKIVLCQRTELHEWILQTMRFCYIFGKIHPADYGPLSCLTVPSPLSFFLSQIGPLSHIMYLGQKNLIWYN